jgi:hypothetical protein
MDSRATPHKYTTKTNNQIDYKIYQENVVQYLGQKGQSKDRKTRYRSLGIPPPSPSETFILHTRLITESKRDGHMPK